MTAAEKICREAEEIRVLKTVRPDGGVVAILTVVFRSGVDNALVCMPSVHE